MTTEGKQPKGRQGRQEQQAPDAQASGRDKQQQKGRQGRQEQQAPGAQASGGEKKGRPQGQPQGKQAAPEAKPAPPAPPQPRVIPSLLVRYQQQVRPALRKEFGYTNDLQAPRVMKVVLNIGLGEALTNANAAERASQDLALITGQRPVVTRAKRDIAGFKLRGGQPIGVMATLHSDRMYTFLERLLVISLPRIRDFRGTPRDAFDGRGNYSLGIREHIIFPEIEYGKVDKIRGLQVNIVTNARNDREAFRLLELLGMPFARDGARAAS
ncbi:MAG: 50S ribosomal protein L5 [Dehalococcoidia bacterium]|nr:50S ribosomal protein L5 [Dehalococcoidia bacterium]